jgi:hypothetical protein
MDVAGLATRPEYSPDQARDSSAWRTLPRVSGLNNIATTRLPHPTVVPISIGIANPRCQSVAK